MTINHVVNSTGRTVSSPYAFIERLIPVKHIFIIHKVHFRNLGTAAAVITIDVDGGSGYVASYYNSLASNAQTAEDINIAIMQGDTWRLNVTSTADIKLEITLLCENSNDKEYYKI